MPVLPSLARRERIPELMDDPGLDPAKHRRALAALARINRWSRSAAILSWPIWSLGKEVAPRLVRVLDVATGSGDVPRAIELRALKAGLEVEAVGCDASPTAVAAATAAGVTAFVHDALRDPLPDGYDVVTCSLFLHHLADDDAVTLLRRMKEAAGSLVLVNDLSRSRFGYLGVWLACHLLTRSPVVRFDGPASVRSAYTPAEALALAGRAGLAGATVESRFPCRFLLQWRRA
ncbi:MAG: methyltransferase domain-containing protein [Gemmataceae bacterium]|nr:methyltransferase domain-containing protein [Gemmataceae bacterium]